MTIALRERLERVRSHGPLDIAYRLQRLTIEYTGQPVHLVNGRVNGPWFGSFWPDSPQIFETEESLHTLWAGPRRLFLLTYSKDRAHNLSLFGSVRILASAGGKTILTNQ